MRSQERRTSTKVRVRRTTTSLSYTRWSRPSRRKDSEALSIFDSVGAITALCILLLSVTLLLFSFAWLSARRLLHWHSSLWEGHRPEFSLLRSEWEETYPNLVCLENRKAIGNKLPQAPWKLINNSIHVPQATASFNQNGALGLIPELLAASTCHRLRTYVLRRNSYYKKSPENQMDIIQPNQRITFAPSIEEDSSIRDALQELGRRQDLRDLLEGVLQVKGQRGAHVSLVEFQLITAYYGADSQHWHADTAPEVSATRYGTNIAPLVTLLIPLQDTTPGMGATALCPTSHRCAYTLDCSGIPTKDKKGSRIQAPFWTGQGLGFNETYWPAGHGLLYSSTTQHRGGAHVDPGAPPRVALLTSWTVRDGHFSDVSRLPPLGTVIAIRPDHLGWTFDDLKDWKLTPKSVLMTVLEWVWGQIDSREPKYRGWDVISLILALLPVKDQYRLTYGNLEEIVNQRQGLVGVLSSFLFLSVQEDAPSNMTIAEYHGIRLLKRTLWLSGLISVAAFLCVLFGVSRIRQVNNRWVGSGVLTAFVCVVAYLDASRLTTSRSLPAKLSKVLNQPSPQELPVYSATLVAPILDDYLLVPHARALPPFDLVPSHPGNRRFEYLVEDLVSTRSFWQISPQQRRQRLQALRSIDFGNALVVRQTKWGDWSKLSGKDLDSFLAREVYHAMAKPLRSFSRIRSRLPTTKDWPILIDVLLDIGSDTRQRKSSINCRGFGIWSFSSMLHRRKQLEDMQCTDGPTFLVGQLVEARVGYGASHKWVHAKIDAIHPKKADYVDLRLFDIQESVEEWVHIENVRPLPPDRRWGTWAPANIGLLRAASEPLASRTLVNHLTMKRDPMFGVGDSR